MRPDKWKESHAYASAKYPMEIGDDISKQDMYEEIKEAFEKGYEQCIKDYSITDTLIDTSPSN